MTEEDRTPIQPIRLNIQMIADTMEEKWWEFTANRAGDPPELTGCQLYCGQKKLRRDILYLIPQGREKGFPADVFSYVTTGPLAGDAPHLRLVRQEEGEVMNHVLSVFQRYREFEHTVSSIISGGGSLSQLCQAASEFFHNPLFIHDSLFTVLATSHLVPGMPEFEYNEKTRKMYVPLWLIDEFKFDEGYKETLPLRRAAVWSSDGYSNNIRSLFVNLWDGELYRGRLLINEIATPLQPGQARAAEHFAQYIVAWMRSMEQRQISRSHNFEETFLELMTTGQTNSRDLRTVLNILGWKEEDRYLCMKLQNQNPNNAVRSGNALNSRLTSALSECITFVHDQQLCAVVNMDKAPFPTGSIRACLAPVVRDGCLYCGISHPIRGIRALSQGFRQADFALRYITEKDRSEWIVPFVSCALSYVRDRACGELPAAMVAHPVLQELKDHDAATGSDYYKTLGTYLRWERSIPQTAAALIIHRTTLTYRLGKIQELTRLNLDDPDLRLYLLLSYQLMEG